MAPICACVAAGGGSVAGGPACHMLQVSRVWGHGGRLPKDNSAGAIELLLYLTVFWVLQIGWGTSSI